MIKVIVFTILQIFSLKAVRAPPKNTFNIFTTLYYKAHNKPLNPTLLFLYKIFNQP